MSKRNLVIILVIGGYLVFNRTFQVLRIPPVSGAGMPAGEFLLLVSVFYLIKDLKWFPSFANNLLFLIFLPWWLLGLSRAFIAVPEYGIYGLRDASHVIESLFLWVGFVFAAAPGAMEFFFVWLRRILVFGCLLSLTYPFRHTVSQFTPSINTLEGLPLNLFTTHLSWPACLLWEATRRVVLDVRANYFILALIIAYAVAMFQARTIYLQLLSILVIIMFYRPRIFMKLIGVLMIGFTLFLAVEKSGLEIQGRLRQPISTEFIVKHVYAMVGVESKGVENAAKGVDLRFNWWKDIFDRVMETNTTMFFGLGYGHPLIPDVGNHGLMREPHNSMVSTFGRLGLTGVTLIILGHLCLVWYWFQAFRLCRQHNYKLGQDRLIVLIIYPVLVWWLAMGEPAFESPYLTIPYYFVWGVIVQYRLLLMKQFEVIKETASEGSASSDVENDSIVVGGGIQRI